MEQFLLGYDVGSSSVKATLVEAESGKVMGSATSPEREMGMLTPESGWAEQDPAGWWKHLVNATQELIRKPGVDPAGIRAIGISYQMHGLVLVDRDKNVLRPSIIWCDSRAVDIGEKAFASLGGNTALTHLLNSPGNFTASKLKWVMDNEPELYDRVDKFMLPGDYIAMKMTGEVKTTIPGLSEGILWDFLEKDIAGMVLDEYGINRERIPDLVDTFGIQGELTAMAADELGLPEGISVSYRAGDQPNNAFSLNVLNPGEIAATAGTSGVIFGLIDQPEYDPQSRVNTFVHVNHSTREPRYGILLCINGTGILNSWLKHHTGDIDYDEMNALASEIPVGSQGLKILPFGNGAERVLGNREQGGSIHGLNFNVHKKAHLLRAAQEGIVFALKYGFDIMKRIGMEMNVVRAGNANMFLSPVFRQAFVNTTNTVVELYDTDGSQGAARGAGVGAGIYADFGEAFNGLQLIQRIEPDKSMIDQYTDEYKQWLNILNRNLK